MDHAKAVAAYTRSDAGAGMGDAAILPSDLRTPAALVVSLCDQYSTLEIRFQATYLSFAQYSVLSTTLSTRYFQNRHHHLHGTVSGNRQTGKP